MMAQRLSEGLRLGKFPPFTSISVADNFFAGIWAGIVQDVEAVVSEFILFRDWDYRTFVQIAENRGIIVLHRCAFSIFNPDKSIVLQSDRSTRGRTRDQYFVYKRIMNMILNASKDIWLEPLLALKGRNPVADLKRRIAGLYILYYLWHNQVPIDDHKVLIRYCPDDQIRASAVGETFLKLEKKIPNATLVKSCYKYLITSLSKRNAFVCTYIVDEPKIDFQYWQQLYLKNTGMRKCVTSVNANGYFYQMLPELEKLCGRMTSILKQVDSVANVPVAKSLFFRKILPLYMIKSIVKFDDKTLEPVGISLPFSYIRIAEVIVGLVSKNVMSIERPFLTLDTLLQTDRAPEKIRLNGIRMANDLKKKYIYNKTAYEKNKAFFNTKCEEQHVPKYKISRTKKYREMKSPGWLFINKEFLQIFNQEANKNDPSLQMVRNKVGDEPVAASSSVVTVRGSNPKVLPKNVECGTGEQFRTRSTHIYSNEPYTSISTSKRVSTRTKRAPAKLGNSSEEISYKELILGTTDTGMLQGSETVQVDPLSQLIESYTKPNFRRDAAELSTIPQIKEVIDATSFDLDEDEKLLQEAIHGSGTVVVAESTETLKSIYGLHRRAKRRRGMIDPLSIDEGDLNASFSSQSDDVSVVNLESSDEDPSTW